jgi:hypothetical protein
VGPRISLNAVEKRKILRPAENRSPAVQPVAIPTSKVVPRHEDEWWSGDIAPPFLTSAKDGGEWSASCSGRFTPGERDHGTL